MESSLSDQLAALAHPKRRAIFQLLVRRCPDDVAAGEIARVLDLKASTASVYLSALARARLIRQTRRGTSLLYALDTEGAQNMIAALFMGCCRGRPDLCPPDLVPATGGLIHMSKTKFNVLFICTGNSARSIFAEAIMRREAGDRFNVFSAGTHPSGQINPFALAMLRDKGMDMAPLASKSVSAFQGPDAPALDFVFTVCDQAANEECPAWSGQPISAHWGLPDPVKAEGTDAQKRLAFQQTYGMMRNRIRAFTALPLDTLDRVSLQRRVDEIGANKEPA